MFYQILLLPQLKKWPAITCKHELFTGCLKKWPIITYKHESYASCPTGSTTT